MDKINDVVVVSATDLVAHLACRHVTWLDRRAAAGEINKPLRNDPMLELLQDRGLAPRGRLPRAPAAARARSVVEIADPAGDGVAPVRSSGAPDPARRRDGGGHGRACRRHLPGDVPRYRRPCRGGAVTPTSCDGWRQRATSGDWAYEPEDTKLSAIGEGISRAPAVLLRRAGRALPGHGARSGPCDPWRQRAGVGAPARGVGLLPVRQGTGSSALSATAVEPYPLPCDHCAICRWAGRCHGRWDRRRPPQPGGLHRR